MPQSPDDPSLEAPFLSHLLELKDRLTRSVIAILAIFICFAPFAFDIYDLLVEPLTSHFPNNQEALIAFKIVSPILTPYKLILVLAVYVAMPYLLYQVWSFIAPGLYQHEKKFAYPLLVSSAVLYYVGMAFAYFVVLPLVFGFLTSVGPESMNYTPDISEYLDFVLAVFLAFGLAFEVPIATIILIATGLAEVESLKAKRPYVVIGAFVIGMFLTPPDVISQTLLAIPMWLLFEAGLFFSAMFVKPRKDEYGQSDEPTPATAGSTGGVAAAGAATAGAAAAGFAETSGASSVEETSIEDPTFGDSEEYREMTEEEMEAQLDALDDDDEEDDDEDYHDETTASEESEQESADSDSESEENPESEEKDEVPWHLQKHDDDYADEP